LGVLVMWTLVPFLQIDQDDCIGLIGLNGVGKTTLMKLLTGLEEVDSGQINYTPPNLEILYLPQYPQFDEQSTVLGEVLKTTCGQEKSYVDAEVKAKKALNEVGLKEELWIQKARNLSGGEKTKLMLCQAMVNEFDMLFLDEPTNHLDMDSCSWLEDFLKQLKKPMLLISHDRYFFDNVTNKIWELTPEKLKSYPGNYSAYKMQKEKEINVTFPEDYHSEELAGKPAIFKVKVKGIKVKEYSPLDDEFAKDVSEFETLEELKNDIRNKLKEAAENRSLSEVKIAVINKAAENAEVEIPEIMIESKIASYVNEMAQRLAQQGLKFEHYLEYSGQTMEQIKETFKPQAKKEVKNDLVIEAIAKAENIIATEEEVDKEIEKMAKYYNQEAGKLKEMFAAQGNLPALEASIQLDKAVDFLVSEAKIEIVSDGKEETKKEE
jgi:ABC-type multidrug transport system ATPase subunit